ncbi:MAG: hypothetical protein D6762_02445 [Candidatus Neomarinimicrobiota bacterium]|nr:MAG: hypothetical protein D6762_02445 [Candidatus Neomarinimicrobiota bacterium]
MWPNLVGLVAGLWLVAGPADGSPPSIQVYTTVLTPRLHLVETETTTAWRNLVVIRQPVGSRGEWFTSLEYGSENPYWQNAFRVHQLYWQQRSGAVKIRLGRLAQWDALQNLRIDGGELILSTRKWGSVRLLAGVKAVTDFSDTAFQDLPEWSLTWSKGNWGRNLEVSTWQKSFGHESRTFTGLSFHGRVLGWRWAQAVSVDLTGSRLHHLRTRVSRRIGNRDIAFGFRQKRSVGGEVWSWVRDPIRSAPTVFLGCGRERDQARIWQEVSYRFQHDVTWSWTGTVAWRSLQLSLVAGRRDLSRLVGTSLGYHRSLGKHLSSELTASWHAFAYGHLTAPSPSSLVREQLRWSVAPGIALVIFGQWAQNPYYISDGRGGVTLHVAL